MARRAAPRRRNKRGQADTPFLKLPGELRNRIYELTLVKDTPIELFSDTIDISPSTRAQKDLVFVRKNLAAGLLRTCRQIYKETVRIFYGDNTFYFTGGHFEDASWMLYRFLLTISPTYDGPGSRQYLTRIGIKLPSRENPEFPIYTLNVLNACSKNSPKTHLVKVADTFWADHIEQCVSLVATDKALKEFHFVVPSGWIFRDDWVIREYREMIDLYLPFLIRTVLFVLRDAFLDLENPVEFVNGSGWELVLEEGSYINCKGDKNSEGLITWEKIRVDNRREFRLPTDEYGYLNGVSDLFDNQGELVRAWIGGW
ncbi:MAG: hypothetical protein M1812_001034 [Candelaria pacifica]|nr:MAG: hypothetical protein M1812_001034 [Candelaria pacifica]